MRLKERCGGTVTAVTMGPPQAEAMMKEAYMMGARSGICIYRPYLCRGGCTGYFLYIGTGYHIHL